MSGSKELRPIGQPAILQGLRFEPITPLTPESERRNPTLVGGFIFDKNRSLLVAVKTSNGISTEVLDATMHRDVALRIKEKGRLIVLNSFRTLATKQVGLDAKHIEIQPTIGRHPELNIHFNATDTGTGEISQNTVSEQDVLSLFVGDRGAIIQFTGHGLTEETGLLFESVTGEEKRATIFFMYPGHEAVPDSAIGLEQFLKVVNEALMGDESFEFQNRALRVLKKLQANPKTGYGTADVRSQIARLNIISLARMAELHPEKKKYLWGLKEVLPGFRRWVPDSALPKKSKKEAAISIDELIVTPVAPLLSEAPQARTALDMQRAGEKPEKEPKLLIDRMQTKEGKELLGVFNTAAYQGKTDLMGRIYNRTRTELAIVRTLPELHDLELILEQMLNRFDGEGLRNFGGIQLAEVRLEIRHEIKRKRALLIA